MSLDRYSSLMETVHLLRSPANAEHLRKSIERYRQGKVEEKDLLNELALCLDGSCLILSVRRCYLRKIFCGSGQEESMMFIDWFPR
ncbi:MAG: hypothetical protein KDH88_12825 [Chromatiales bacterium]|nr:hypothetical protein [Chromatiales bacterium]